MSTNGRTVSPLLLLLVVLLACDVRRTVSYTPTWLRGGVGRGTWSAGPRCPGTVGGITSSVRRHAPPPPPLFATTVIGADRKASGLNGEDDDDFDDEFDEDYDEDEDGFEYLDRRTGRPLGNNEYVRLVRRWSQPACGADMCSLTPPSPVYKQQRMDVL